MPLPLIPVIVALTSGGGSLVAHAGGGMIVTGASGYIAGTYLSSAAIATLVSTLSASALGTLALGFSSVVGFFSATSAAVVGTAGILGTGIGASGITGTLISLGVISTTPIWLPVLGVIFLLSLAFLTYKLFRMKKKLNEVKDGQQEVKFTPFEARVVEQLLKRTYKKKPELFCSPE